MTTFVNIGATSEGHIFNLGVFLLIELSPRIAVPESYSVPVRLCYGGEFAKNKIANFGELGLNPAKATAIGRCVTRITQYRLPFSSTPICNY